MPSLYNDHDAKACAWLRELVAGGHLPPGDVDARSIADLAATDLAGREQVHLFAGIGGWPLALDMAGWSGPVWTGSCPCQPFSTAGKRRGTDDERHLWPEMRRLIAECRPPVVFGEQVAGRAGREWLAGVRADLEALGYAVGAADLCAAGVGAPHIRQRLYWGARRLADSHLVAGGQGRALDAGGDQQNGAIARPGPGHSGGAHGLGNALREGRTGQSLGQLGASREGDWSAFASILCLDGKARRTEPGIRPLADGIPARVVRLRGYGNAIVPQLAAQFVRAFADSVREAA